METGAQTTIRVREENIVSCKKKHKDEYVDMGRRDEIL